MNTPEHALLIREHRIEDLPAYLDWQCDPRMQQFVDWLPRTPAAAAEASLQDAIAQQNHPQRQRYFYAILLSTPEHETVIGDVGITLLTPGIGDCGWFLRADFQGQGYGTAAVRQLVRHGFTSLKLTELRASCRRSNKASTGIMHHCGFQLVRESPARLWFAQSAQTFLI